MSTWTTKQEEDHPHQHFATTSANAGTVSAADATLSAAHARAADKGRVKKLNKEGMAIILDYLAKNNGGEFRITKPQAQQVAIEVREKTGYEEINAVKIQEWVKRKRQAASKTVTPIAPSSVPSSASSTSQGLMFKFRHWTQAPLPGPTASASGIQNDSLIATKVGILETLISQRTGGIDDALISTWATSLTIDRDLVKSLVQKRAPLPTPISPYIPPWLRPDSRPFADRIAQTSVDTHPRLPTPADSSAGSPVVAFATVPLERHSSSTTSVQSHRSPTPAPPPPATSISTSSEAMNVDSDSFRKPSPALADTDAREPILKCIIEGVKEAIGAPPSPPAVLPRTATEFNALWASYDSKLNQLAQSLA